MRIPGNHEVGLRADGASEYRVIIGVFDDYRRDDRRNHHRDQGCIALDNLSRTQADGLETFGELLATENAA